MKVLYISDRQAGGIAQHVQCLTECLPADVERYVIGIGGDEPFAGRNGHDIREWFQIRRVIREFKPDVVHFHIPNLLMAVYVKMFFRGKLVCSWHLPTDAESPRLGEKLFLKFVGRNCYFLPVSSVTWKGLRHWLPHVQGEVFFNPVRIGRLEDWKIGSLEVNPPNLQTSKHLTIGMVGRNAAQKDWPAFHAVVECIQRNEKVGGGKVEKVGGGGERKLRILNAGEEGFCDGRAAIAQMDLFVMTSKHEELPTTVLECFMAKTPICGFIPKGGMADILALSNGALREVFIAERSVEKLAEIAERVLDDGELRTRIVDDGWQILTRHFDAEKNVKGQLMRVYKDAM